MTCLNPSISNHFIFERASKIPLLFSLNQFREKSSIVEKSNIYNVYGWGGKWNLHRFSADVQMKVKVHIDTSKKKYSRMSIKVEAVIFFTHIYLNCTKKSKISPQIHKVANLILLTVIQRYGNNKTPTIILIYWNIIKYNARR